MWEKTKQKLAKKVTSDKKIKWSERITDAKKMNDCVLVSLVHNAAAIRAATYNQRKGNREERMVFYWEGWITYYIVIKYTQTKQKCLY